jgi:fibronectin-binding autotransporter adhesin
MRFGRNRRALRLALLATTAVGAPSFGPGLPAAAQTLIDYDATPNQPAPLVLTDDTVLHRNFQNTAPAVQSAPISGAFDLTKTGWGTLSLTGDNSGYSGTTTLQEGALLLGHDNALGTGLLRTRAGTMLLWTADRTIANAIDLDNAGWTFFTSSSGTMTLDGTIGGTGGLQKEGPATLILNGANTYSGGTRINNGTVVANNDTALGSGVVELYSVGRLALGHNVLIGNHIELTGIASTNARLHVETDDSAVYSGNISERSAGLGFTKTGAGTLELRGVNSHTGLTHVAEGMLVAATSGSLSQLSDVQIDAGAELRLMHTSNMGGLSGAGTLNVGTYLASLGYDNGSAVFEGTVMGSGSGQIGKRGTGAQTLAGDSAGFNGTLHAEVGTLLVNADFSAASARLYGGATFGGTGTVQNIVDLGGGTIAPGNGPGSIGRLETVEEVEFAAGSVFEVDVNAQGQSDLLAVGDHAALDGRVEVRAAGGNYAPSTDYQILTATNGISGAFSDVTTNLAFLTPELTYEVDSVWLRLSRNLRAFADLGGLSFNQRAVAPAAEALGGGNAVHDALLATTDAEARAGFDSLSGEIHATNATVLAGTAGFVRDAILERARPTMTDPYTGSLADRWKLSAWATGLGGFQYMGSDGNAGRVDSATGGVVFGVQADNVDGFRLGMAGGYTNSNARGAAGPSSADIEAFHVSLYGAARMDALSVRMGAGYARNEIRTSRQVAIGGFADTLTASYVGHVGQAFGEVGYEITAGSVSLEPFAGLAHVAVGTGAFTESGGPAALSVAASGHGATFSTLGLRAAHDLYASSSGVLTATGGIAWCHAFDAAPLRSMAFASGGSVFTVAGLPAARDALVLDAGLNWRVAGMNVGARYTGSLGGSASSHSVNARLNVAF